MHLYELFGRPYVEARRHDVLPPIHVIELKGYVQGIRFPNWHDVGRLIALDILSDVQVLVLESHNASIEVDGYTIDAICIGVHMESKHVAIMGVVAIAIVALVAAVAISDDSETTTYHYEASISTPEIGDGTPVLTLRFDEFIPMDKTVEVYCNNILVKSWTTTTTSSATGHSRYGLPIESMYGLSEASYLNGIVVYVDGVEAVRTA